MKFLCTLFLILTGLPARAAVWEHEPDKSWNADWHRKYANWIATEVTPTYFKDLGRPFSDLRMDCADTHYALVAYFAARHRLPFAVNLGGTTNLSNRFDHLPPGQARLAAFIAFLRANYGTESLSHRDTYPVAIKRLMPGDLFMFKVGSNGNFTRHTYIIKNINPDGTFDVLYSTQAIAEINGSLKRNRSYMFTVAPTNRGADHRFWGFRRMKLPQEAHIDQAALPQTSFEQYDWAFNLSATEFFRRVKKANQKIAESPQMALQRNFTAVCNSVKERIDAVNKGLARQRALGGACMDFTDYDAHSTPARDAGIMMEYRTYRADFDEIRNAGRLSALREETRFFTETVFTRQRSEQEMIRLYTGCRIDFGSRRDQSTDLGSFRDALFAGWVSFHPNDTLYQRWGFEDGGPTSCPEYYGYPSN